MIDVEEMTSLLEPNGVLFRTLKGYEKRPMQVEMLRSVATAFHHNQIALIEAGTGIGKSIAYLIPAILWAAETGEKTIISSATIALQQQLIEKDLPTLLTALDLDLKVVLVKGMHNYLCLKKLKDTHLETEDLSYEDRENLFKIEKFTSQMIEGSRHELPFKLTQRLWEKIMAESDSCNHVKCPHYKECFFFASKKKAEEAHLLIANHHLLFADLSIRSLTQNHEETCVIPFYRKIILDEAHHIEDIATEYFAKKVSRLGLAQILGRLISDRGGGKLLMLKKKIEQLYPKGGEQIEAILSQITLDLSAQKRGLMIHIEKLFTAIADFFSDQTEEEVRIRSKHLEQPFWIQHIQPLAQKVLDNSQKFVVSIQALCEKIELLNDFTLAKGTEGIRNDLNGISSSIPPLFNILHEFLFTPEEISKVKWIETKGMNVSLTIADLEVAPILKEHLFDLYPTVTLCSATLATDHSFTFIKKRLGISEREHIIERIYPSPFDFEKQALLAVPTDLPLPNHPDFLRKATELIRQAIEASDGGAFILFTSYLMLKTALNLLYFSLEAKGYSLFIQGEGSRHALLESFRKSKKGILFGTDTFWEGVDVVGDALRCVILAKLPFRVPTEPLMQARAEAIAEKGGNPFFDYALPQAVMKFKQGFGRLIRNQRDRGCVLCLDTRLVNKEYGQLFFKSLPNVATVFDSASKLPMRLQAFYAHSSARGPCS
ncbi:MAG: DEAD/DEAH box helicase [Chlamydiia bacterium]|nr:DEAD/DEAH box helicase [Chlamydiia bacterium]